MSEKCIRLELPDSIINCFGVQPSFLKSGICDRIALFSLYRFKKWFRDDAKTNNVYYEPCLYKGRNAQIAYEMATHVNDLEYKTVKTLWENASHIAINYSLEQLRNDKLKLREILLYYSELLRYWNRLNRGNFFITSDETIYNNTAFAFKQLQKYSKYIVSNNILKEDVIIIGAKGMTAFDNPIIASPFIEREKYENFLRDHKLSDFYQMDMKKRFPVMEKMNHIYDNYQLYINENVPQKWHVETFKNTKLYYIVLHLKG